MSAKAIPKISQNTAPSRRVHLHGSQPSSINGKMIIPQYYWRLFTDILLHFATHPNVVQQLIDGTGEKTDSKHMSQNIEYQYWVKKRLKMERSWLQCEASKVMTLRNWFISLRCATELKILSFQSMEDTLAVARGRAFPDLCATGATRERAHNGGVLCS